MQKPEIKPAAEIWQLGLREVVQTEPKAKFACEARFRAIWPDQLPLIGGLAALHSESVRVGCGHERLPVWRIQALYGFGAIGQRWSVSCRELQISKSCKSGSAFRIRSIFASAVMRIKSCSRA